MSKTHSQVAKLIAHDSALIDAQFKAAPAEDFKDYSLSLIVPPHHSRSAAITETIFRVGSLRTAAQHGAVYYLVDASLKGSNTVNKLGDQAHFVEADEVTLKERGWLDDYIAANVPTSLNVVVGIGGGVLLNAAAYIAEKRTTDFVAVPTTVLAASDSAIGGLVRINAVYGVQYVKSAYKSVYEPSRIVIDPKLLATLPRDQISLGLSEIIKHGVYQSNTLLKYMASDAFNPFSDQASLLKAICWTAALKNVTIVHDPDSLSSGGDILRGGHKLALAIEEDSHFKVSHSQAVAVGVYQDALHSPSMDALLDAIYEKFGLPKMQIELGDF